MFSAVLATCLLLYCFGVSSEHKACVWPHHLFLIQTWEVNSCLGRRWWCTHTHTHRIIHQVRDSVTIHSVTITMILYLLQFVSSVTANNWEAQQSSYTVLLLWKSPLVTKHLIAFSFSLLLIVLTGSYSLNSPSVALLTCCRAAHMHICVGWCRYECVRLSLCEVRGFTSMCISRGVHVLTATSATGYWAWFSTQETLMAFALLADMSVVLGVASHRAYSSVVKYL